MGEQQKQEGLVQMVTQLHSINEQIGGHIITALQRQGTAAVLSVVVPGIGPDRIVSVPLNPNQLAAIQGMLSSMDGAAELSPEARRAIGFGRKGGEE